MDAWDGARSYCSVVRDDEGTWHLFYFGLPTDESLSYTCYAYSEDQGTTWVKPILNTVSHAGSSANNILMPGGFVSAFYDQTLAKWVMVLETNAASGGTAAAYIHTADFPTGPWTLVKTLDPDGYNEGKSLARRANGTWVMHYTYGQIANDREIGCMISRTEDLGGTWDVGPSIFTSSSTAQQYYTVTTIPFAERLLGMVVDYDGSGAGPNVGYSVIDLYDVSDPVFGWTKIADSWIPRGSSGAWDDSSLYHGSIIEDGDEWHVFYVGTSEAHNASAPIGLNVGHAWIPRGRLASYSGTGSLTTTRVWARGRQLLLNADATGGSVDVELVDSEGTPLAGYSAAEFDTITGDDLDHPCTWGGQGLPRGVYRIRIVATTASVFGYRLT